MHKRIVAWIGAVLALGGAACSSAPKLAGALRSGPIVELHVITAPVGLNLDQLPGVDGFSMKLYANNASNPKTVPLGDGALEILMFNGTFYGRTNAPVPAKTWPFGPAELKNHEIESSLGTGYEFVLVWGTNRPTQRLITVQARYSPSQGGSIISPPSSVTVLDR